MNAKRNPTLRAKLFTRGGFPCAALRNALSYFDAKDLGTLESRVDCGDLDRHSLSRLRGGGQPNAPGVLLQYLFALPSGKQLRAARIDAEWSHGAGI